MPDVWRHGPAGDVSTNSSGHKRRGMTLRRLVLLVGIIGLFVTVSVSDGNGGS